MLSVLENLEKIEFKAGDYLFREGEENYSFYIIQEGQIDIFINDSSKKEMILATLGPGDPVGEFALIVRKPRSASARSKTAGYAMKVSEKGYESLLKELPEWALHLMTSLICRLRQTDELLRSTEHLEKTKSSFYDLFNTQIDK